MEEINQVEKRKRMPTGLLNKNGEMLYEGDIIEIPICKYYKPEMDVLREYCNAFYKLPGCGCGGPLHILLDDDNYEDNHIQFCLDECSKYPDAAVAALGVIICREYLKMSLPQRSVFSRYLCGWSVECCSTCDKCELMDLDISYLEVDDE